MYPRIPPGDKTKMCGLPNFRLASSVSGDRWRELVKEGDSQPGRIPWQLRVSCESRQGQE